ncbi:MAG: DUF1573 domain-containing protein [Muribaculaceae bacterium]
MRKIISILTLGAVVSAFAAGLSHDFGLISADGGIVSRRFWIRNDADSAMAIVKVRTSCGCTAVDYDRHSIVPGDSAYVDVSFNPAGRYGRQSKTVHVSTSAGRSTITIQATVKATDTTIELAFPRAKGSLHLTADSLAFNDLRRGDASAQVVHIYNNSPDTVALTANVPEWVRVVSERPTLPPYEEEPVVVQVLTARCPADTAATATVAGAPIHVAVSYRK